jgi:hypothetical protein
MLVTLINYYIIIILGYVVSSPVDSKHLRYPPRLHDFCNIRTQ